MKAGAADYLSRHLTVETLERTIRHALALHAEERQRWHAERRCGPARSAPRAGREHLPTRSF